MTRVDGCTARCTSGSAISRSKGCSTSCCSSKIFRLMQMTAVNTSLSKLDSVTKITYLPDFKSIAQLWDSNCCCIEEVVSFWSNTYRLRETVSTGRRVENQFSYPSLNSRSFVRQETEIEVARLLPIECEAVHTLGWVGGNK